MANVTDWSSLASLLGKLQESPGSYVQIATSVWLKRMRLVLNDLDLTPTQFKVMASIANLMEGEEGAPQSKVAKMVKAEVTQNDVANSIWMDKMTVSEVLRTLEKKGWVARVESKKDKRAKSLILTNEGFYLLFEALNKAVAVDEELFPQGEERDQMVDILKRHFS
jgi:DNA-binding MarR family transcriptional regulator